MSQKDILRDLKALVVAYEEAAIREHHKADRVVIDEVSTISPETWNDLEADKMRYFGGARKEGKSKDAPKSAHKKGERYEGNNTYFTPDSTHLVYAGELRCPRAGEWYEYPGGVIHVRLEDGFKESAWPEPREILTLVPDEPEPKYTVGQYVVYTEQSCYPQRYAFKMNNGDYELSLEHPEYYRPAVPADFTVTVGNMKVRAYETDSYLALLGSVLLKWSDGSDAFVNSKVAAAYGYPIIPLSVSGGKFEAPK